MKALDVTSVLFLTLVFASPSVGEAQARQVLQPGARCGDQPDAAIVTFEDANLEARIRSALSVGARQDLTCGLVSGLTRLDAGHAGIASLVGIQNLTSLTFLALRNNSITDINALSGLTGLTYLTLRDNSITDIQPLLDNANNGGLGSGDRVFLSGTNVSCMDVTLLIAKGMDVIGIAPC